MKVTMRRVKVTPEEFDRLRRLDLACRTPVIYLGDGSGMAEHFDDERWVAGVEEILGERAPKRDYEPTAIEVVSDPA
jgi:hypothetical protein